MLIFLSKLCFVCLSANIDETCELEFNCSSLDTTDSENESDVDLPSSQHGLHNTEKSTAATKGQKKDGIVFFN